MARRLIPTIDRATGNIAFVRTLGTPVDVPEGGTGEITIPAGSIFAAQATDDLSPVTYTGPSTMYLQNASGIITWAAGSSGGTGTVTGAQNVGAGGQGIFKQLSGSTLQLYNINVASNKLSVTLDAGNNEVDLDVNEANLVLPNITQITSRSHTQLTDIGTYTHTQIDTHIDAFAPHPGHELLVNKSVALGYAGLDSNAHVPTTLLGSGSAVASTFLAGNQTWVPITPFTLPTTGTAGSVPYIGSNQLLTTDYPNFTYLSSTLSAPKATISTLLTAQGSGTVAANLSVGTSTQYSKAQLYVNRTQTNNVEDDFVGFMVGSTTLSSANSNSIVGLFVEQGIDGASNYGVSLGLKGIFGQARLLGSQTVSSAAGLVAKVKLTGTGVITQGYGLAVSQPEISGGGSVTRLAGIVVDDQSAAGNRTGILLGTLTIPSANYALYSASQDATYLGGGLTVAALTPTRLVISTAASALSSNLALTNNGFLYAATASGQVGSTTAPTNGQLPIGVTGGPPVAANLTGTSNQIIVTNGAGSITLSCPQDIGTGSSPTFSNLTLSARTTGRVAYFTTGGAFTDSAAFTFNGTRLTLSTTGNTGGLSVGGDVEWYRVSANQWFTPDTVQIVPANFSLASAAGYSILATSTAAPAADTAQRVFGLSFTSVGSTNFNYTDATGGITGLQSAAQYTGGGTVTAMAMGIFSGTASGTGTITTLNQVYSLGYDVSTGQTVTTFNGMRSDLPRASGAGLVTTAYAFVCHPRTFSSATLTNAIGVGVFPNGNLIAHSANSQVRLGVDIGAMPSPGAFTGTTTAAIRIQGTNGSRDAILFSDTRVYRSAASILSCDGGFVSLNATKGLGYATGAGSAVTQLTSKSTGVTMNTVCGQITMNNASLAAGASVSFTFTNSTIAATDTVIVNIASAATADSYDVTVTAVASTSCRIQVHNFTAGALGEALVLNYAVIKSVAA